MRKICLLLIVFMLCTSLELAAKKKHSRKSKDSDTQISEASDSKKKQSDSKDSDNPDSKKKASDSKNADDSESKKKQSDSKDSDDSDSKKKQSDSKDSGDSDSKKKQSDSKDSDDSDSKKKQSDSKDSDDPKSGSENFDKLPIIEGNSDPEKAESLFNQAISSWHKGKQEKARNLYEDSLMSDRSVLVHDDEGMAAFLIDSYKKLVETASSTRSPAKTAILLCRMGFFENILTGNLDDAVDHYEQAAALTVNSVPETYEHASREAARLSSELLESHMWQDSQVHKNKEIEKRELKAYLTKREKESFDERIDDLRTERDEAEKRIEDLHKQEGEAQGRMEHEQFRAHLYRRRIYYSTPPVGGPSAQGSYYYSRNLAEEGQQSLDQIRTEIKGLEERIKEIDKEIEKITEEATKAASEPDKNSSDAAKKTPEGAKGTPDSTKGTLDTAKTSSDQSSTAPEALEITK
ncbi:MAG: hypothetical protein HQM08_17595 [Candidatus Riflebacteria bacterium]|nr:hypothetical protein [Candidatus Riflebacteria bacterium]